MLTGLSLPISGWDLYSQQSQKDVPANFVSCGPLRSSSAIVAYPSLVQDRLRDTPLAANVTVSPFKWNVTQPVGTYWYVRLRVHYAGVPVEA